jgi:hypothetical protein
LVSLLVPTLFKRGETNTMPLSDVAIRMTTPRAKEYKLTDGGGHASQLRVCEKRAMDEKIKMAERTRFIQDCMSK